MKNGVSEYVEVKYYRNWIENIVRHCDDSSNLVCERLLQQTYVRLFPTSDNYSNLQQPRQKVISNLTSTTTTLSCSSTNNKEVPLVNSPKNAAKQAEDCRKKLLKCDKDLIILQGIRL